MTQPHQDSNGGYRIAQQPTTQQVVLILGIVGALVAGAVILAAMKRDATIILTLAGLVAVPVIGAFGVAVYQKLDQVKEISNGNLSRAHEMLSEQAKAATEQARTAIEQSKATTEVLASNAQQLTNITTMLANMAAAQVIAPITPAAPMSPNSPAAVPVP